MQDESKAVQVSENRYQFDHIQVFSGNQITSTATVGITTEGGAVTEAATGDGPVDATYKAISRVTGFSPTLSDYQIRSVTEGMDAIGEVTVKVKEQGRSFVGHGASTDIKEASAKAYINAINKVIHFRENG